MKVYNAPVPDTGVDEELLDEPPQAVVISAAVDTNNKPAASFPIRNPDLFPLDPAKRPTSRLDWILNLIRADPVNFANE